MSESTREDEAAGTPPAADAETSIVRVLLYPLALFIAAPVVVLVIVKYLIGM